MQVNDIENAVLFNLQQSELVNFGGAPAWAQATNPAINQQALLFQINRAYIRTLLDLADCEIELAHFTFTSVANSSDYLLPPGVPAGGIVNNYTNPSQAVPGVDLSGFASVQRISNIYYTPNGQPWTQNMEGGIRLVSWTQFMRFSAFGYLRPFTYNIIPDFCSVTPNRQILSFFPGTASDGDTITVEYVPTLTAGTPWPPLVAGTDSPILPPQADDMLIQWATALCWPKLREMQAAVEYQAMYKAETLRVREELGPRSRGDTFRFSRAEDGLWQSYPIGGALALP